VSVLLERPASFVISMMLVHLIHVEQRDPLVIHHPSQENSYAHVLLDGLALIVLRTLMSVRAALQHPIRHPFCLEPFATQSHLTPCLPSLLVSMKEGVSTHMDLFTVTVNPDLLVPDAKSTSTSAHPIPALMTEHVSTTVDFIAASACLDIPELDVKRNLTNAYQILVRTEESALIKSTATNVSVLQDLLDPIARITSMTADQIHV